MIGTQLGPYTLTALLGTGGMGAVYRAHQASLNRDVAIKILHPGQALDPAQRERFRREAMLLAQLNHPHIVQLLDAGLEDSQTAYLVMEYVEGRTVTQLLHDAGPMGYLQAVRIVSQVASGLGAAHARKLIHRDVKPSNILVAPGPTAKLGDFGVAALSDQPEEARLTLTRAAVGTPHYMSPEQIKARGALTGASDVYSLGVVLYEMLAGKHPFAEATSGEALLRQVNDPFPPLRRVRGDLPDDLERVLLRCLAKEREERYTDGQALHEALEKVRVRLEVLALASGGDATPDTPRVTGTGFFYADGSASGASGWVDAVRTVCGEAWAQVRDPNGRLRRQTRAVQAQAQRARTHYKQLEKRREELTRRHRYHDDKARQHQAAGQAAIEAGRAEEAAGLAEQEAQSRRVAIDYEHQIEALGQEERQRQEAYDQARQRHAALADDLALRDAEAQRLGRRLPSWHHEPRRAQAGYRLLMALLVCALLLAGSVLWWAFGRGGQRPVSTPTPRPAAVVAPAAVELRSGLVAEYLFEGNADDSSGNGLNGTPNGATLVPDRFQRPQAAYQFNGQRQYIDIGDQPLLEIGPHSMSFCAWIKTAVGAQTCILSKMNNAWPYNGYRLTGYPRATDLRSTEGFAAGLDIKAWFDKNQSFVMGKTAIHDDHWHFICGVADRESHQIRVYIDGKREGVSQEQVSGPILAEKVRFFIGGRDGNPEFFNGAIDDVRVYRRALSDAEVQALYTLPAPSGAAPLAGAVPAGAAEVPRGPLVHYPFDRPEKETGGTVRDDSGHGHDGTVHGARWTAEGAVGGAYEFDGQNEYIDLAHVKPGPDQGFSACAWIRRVDRSLIMLSNYRGSDAYDGQFMFEIDGMGFLDVLFGMGPNLYLRYRSYEPDLVSADGWHHVAFAYSERWGAGRKIRIYVDGQDIGRYQIQSEGTAGGILQNADRIRLMAHGASPHPQTFTKGGLDEVMLFDRALTAAEIKKIYASRKR